MPDLRPLIKVTPARATARRSCSTATNYDEPYARARGSRRARPRLRPPLRRRARDGRPGHARARAARAGGRSWRRVVVPIGGGGLIGGVALRGQGRAPGGPRDRRRRPTRCRRCSARCRRRSACACRGATIADGIAVGAPGELTFDLVRDATSTTSSRSSEEEIANAILLLLEIEKTVVEGAGAVAARRAPEQHGRRSPAASVGARAVRRQHRRRRWSRASSSAAWSRTAGWSGSASSFAIGPGALARLTALVGEERANILHIEHDRAFSRAPIGSRAEVELTLETSGREQIDDLKRRLESAGYAVRGARRLAPRPSLPISVVVTGAASSCRGRS